MKILLDFLPLLLFFGTFKYAESHKDWAGRFASEHFGTLVSGGTVPPDDAPVLLATLVVIFATLAQVLYLKLRGRKVDTMLWISLVLVVGLGGLTVWFHNETFIKWKPTGLYWCFGLVFWFSQVVLGKNILKLMLGQQLELPERIWQRLSSAWVVFFGLMGVLNLWVAYHFDTATWVNFKAFGATGLMLAFTIGQGFYLNKHLPADETPPSADRDPPAS